MVDVYRPTYKSRSAQRGMDYWTFSAVGAADLAASGFTVDTYGASGILVARTAEGLIKVTVPRAYPKMGGIAMLDDAATALGLAIIRDPTNDSFTAGAIGFRTVTRDPTATSTDADNGLITFFIWGKGASS